MLAKGSGAVRTCNMPREKMSRILVYGYYGCGNLGDDLIFASIHQWLTTCGGFRQVLVKSRSGCGLPHSAVVAYHQIDRILEAPRDPAWMKAFRLVLEFDRILRAVRFVILGGGTLFHAKNGDPRNLMILALLTRMARRHGVSVYCLGVGVDVIKGCLPRLLFREIVRNARDFAVRDPGSQRNAREAAPLGRFRLAADLVHRLNFSQKGARQRSNCRHLGVTLAGSALRVGRRVWESQGEKLGQVLNLLHKEGWKISFLSFQEATSAHPELSDRTWFEHFSLRYLSFGPEILGPPQSLRQAVAQIRKFGMLLGMRYHSLLIAARCGVPFVGIGQDPKIRSICSTYHMPFQPWGRLKTRAMLTALRQPARLLSAETTNRKQTTRAEANFSQLLQALP